jgi:MFS family permease
VIVGLVALHASLLGQTAYTLAIFAVAALPGYILAAMTIDRIGRKFLQGFGFAVMAAAFIGTYVLAWLLPAIGLGRVSAIVAGVSVLGLLATWLLLPEPRGASLEEISEPVFPVSAVALSVAETRGTRPPAA